MIRIYYGDDRVKALVEIEKILGTEREVVDGAELMTADLPSLMMGRSLLAAQRKILVRDMGENKEVFEKLPEYLETPHEVVLLENKIDKRSGVYKKLKQAGVEMREFALAKPDTRAVFDIYETALKNGPRAVEMLKKIEENQDPHMLVGLMATQAIKKYSWRQGMKEKRVLKELSKLDMDMKRSRLSSQPWTLIYCFLLKLSSL